MSVNEPTEKALKFSPCNFYLSLLQCKYLGSQSGIFVNKLRIVLDFWPTVNYSSGLKTKIGLLVLLSDPVIIMKIQCCRQRIINITTMYK